ncbi:MAG: acyl-CoA dehydrogenase [Micromonosporaceae bacterium]|nr:acyl-CoA dehydrogenase [Micromonosporaceae bacterium]
MSRQDLDFLLYDWLAVDRLVERERFAAHSRETLDALLDLAATIAEEQFVAANRIADVEEPRLGDDGRVLLPKATHDAVAAYLASGLQAATFDAELGGHQLPMTVHKAVSLWFQAASTSVFAYPGLAIGNANTICAHGSPGQVERFVRPVVAGRWLGTMCLSEPEAGSSLADIRTRAVRQEDGRYRLFGTKMWISGADHELSENIVHLVLARTGALEEGVKGLSLFIVPKYVVGDDGRIGERNDVVVAGLNHKMGYRGTTNAVLSFGEGRHQPGGEPGALGELVGREGHGLAYMFHMMNEARIAVGAGAVALGYTGYLRSLAYARTRVQGRPVGDKQAGRPPVPIIRHPDVRRMLLTQKACVEGGLALVLYAARLVDERQTAPAEEDRAAAATFLDVLTPIVKAWPSQWCLHANDLAIQIHGGYGYTRDYPVEQLYRDNRLNAIHEGTNGIQALDLLGRKVRQDGGAGLALLLGAIQATIAKAADRPDLAGYAAELARCVDRIEATTRRLWESGDPATALANASAYLDVVGHTTVAWLWLEQLLAVGDRTGAFFDGKRAAARHFFRYLLPAVHPMLDLLDSLDRSLVDLDDSIL